VALVTEARCVLQLLVTANVLSSLILVTVMMEAIRSSETYVLTRTTRRHIPEDGILHNILLTDNIKIAVFLGMKRIKNVKLSLQHVVEARRFIRRRGSHIF
jgi:hypothetical protein